MYLYFETYAVFSQIQLIYQKTAKPCKEFSMDENLKLI